jgi:16S rRNA (cytosine1402-N4)-methyltransferase
LAALGGGGRVIARDWDQESLEICRRNTERWANWITYDWGRFSNLGGALDRLGSPPVDGLLADLGVSRYQLTSAERGFSMQEDGPLDMRADRTQTLTAADIVNFSSEHELSQLFLELGEERRRRRAARAIVAARPIRSTQHLARVIEQVVPRTGKLHPATRIFLALRLAVSGELEELDALLASLPDVMAPGGRVVIISFMSLEDRKVKRAFQELAREGKALALTKNVVTPAEAEVRANAASRSAKLRALEMAGKGD